MFKNVAAKFRVFAFDATTNVPKTGDAANLTAYVSKDYGAVTVLADTSATEEDATNAPGYYLFDAAQGETNADVLMVSGKSSTANIKVIGAPAVIYTRPTTGWLAPATAGRTLVVDAAGLADANAVKVGPTGSGTAQTARDLGASVLVGDKTGFSLSAAGVQAIWDAATSALTTAGSIGKKLADWTIHSAADVWAVATRVLTAATNITSTGGTTVPQTGDSFARIGAPAGASVSADVAAVKTDTGNLVTRITSTLFSGITSLAQWLGLMAGKQTPDATALTEVKATGAGSGTYDATTDSQEAMRDATALDSTVAKASAVSTLQTSVDDLPTNAELATSQASADDATLAAIAALNNLSAAQVNAEVVDALRTDTGTEVSSVPAAAAPIGAQLQYLYQGLRNKVDVTATAKEVHNDAGTVVGTKTLSDDGTTYSESKAV